MIRRQRRPHGDDEGNNKAAANSDATLALHAKAQMRQDNLDKLAARNSRGVLPNFNWVARANSPPLSRAAVVCLFLAYDGGTGGCCSVLVERPTAKGEKPPYSPSWRIPPDGVWWMSEENNKWRIKEGELVRRINNQSVELNELRRGPFLVSPSFQLTSAQ